MVAHWYNFERLASVAEWLNPTAVRESLVPMIYRGLCKDTSYAKFKCRRRDVRPPIWKRIIGKSRNRKGVFQSYTNVRPTLTTDELLCFLPGIDLELFQTFCFKHKPFIFDINITKFWICLRTDRTSEQKWTESEHWEHVRCLLFLLYL